MVTTAKRERRLREERLGFRVDEPTKALIERAARLERRKLTDFCMTALTDAARRTIAEHETLVLSDRDRAVFFDALVNPQAPSRAVNDETTIRGSSYRLARGGARPGQLYLWGGKPGSLSQDPGRPGRA